MSIHYKFKSSKEVHALNIDRIHISLGELKKQITNQRKLNDNDELDLEISDSNTNKVYFGDDTLIDRNANLIVSRIPITSGKKYNKNETKVEEYVSAFVEEKAPKALKKVSENEEDRIKEMVNQSTKDYDVSKYAKGKGPIGPLRASYICFRCGQGGHYIKHCPTNNIDVKRSTGIPRSFMVTTSADVKGAMMTADGGYAVPIVDQLGYQDVRKEKVPFVDDEKPDIQRVAEVPANVACPLCKGVLQDAVMISCCGASFCDECIRTLLLESDDHQCPECKELGVSPDTLIPNRFLRGQALKFKNESGSFKVTEINVRSPVIIKSDNEDSCEAGSAKQETESEEKLVRDNNELEEKLNDFSKNDDQISKLNGQSGDTKSELKEEDSFSSNENKHEQEKENFHDKLKDKDDISFVELNNEPKVQNSMPKYSLSVAPPPPLPPTLPLVRPHFSGHGGRNFSMQDPFMTSDMSQFYGMNGYGMNPLLNFGPRGFQQPTHLTRTQQHHHQQSMAANGYSLMGFPQNSYLLHNNMNPYFSAPIGENFRETYEDKFDRFHRELIQNGSRGGRGRDRRSRSRSGSLSRSRARRSPDRDDRYRTSGRSSYDRDHRERDRDRRRSRSPRRDTSRYESSSRKSRKRERDSDFESESNQSPIKTLLSPVISSHISKSSSEKSSKASKSNKSKVNEDKEKDIKKRRKDKESEKDSRRRKERDDKEKDKDKKKDKDKQKEKERDFKRKEKESESRRRKDRDDKDRDKEKKRDKDKLKDKKKNIKKKDKESEKESHKTRSS